MILVETVKDIFYVLFLIILILHSCVKVGEKSDACEVKPSSLTSEIFYLSNGDLLSHHYPVPLWDLGWQEQSPKSFFSQSTTSLCLLSQLCSATTLVFCQPHFLVP